MLSVYFTTFRKKSQFLRSLFDRKVEAFLFAEKKSIFFCLFAIVFFYKVCYNVYSYNFIRSSADFGYGRRAA